MRHRHWVRVLGLGLLLASCTTRTSNAGADLPRPGRVVPGITVLLEDSLALVRGKRIGLLTNQAGRDVAGASDIDLLRGEAVTKAGARLALLFSPEHGIRGTEDHTNISDEVDQRSGVRIQSLYTNGTVPPPDSSLRDLDVLVYDLPEVGTRTWTYVGNLVYALRAVKRANIPLIVLDRPAPLTGERRDGPMLDTALANPNDPAPGKPGLAFALYPFPLRHGMTMGELARFYNGELGIGADLHVIPLRGYRRNMWYDETGLPWIKPSPSLPSLTSALIYPSLVAFESSNLSVGRGTPDAFQHFGAPWLKAKETARLLNDRDLAGVKFEEETFTPTSPGDKKYDGQRIPGVKIIVTDRNRIHVGRVGAAILWAVQKTSGDSLKINARGFDLRFGSPALREALLRGEDPDAVMDRTLPGVIAFQERARQYFIYR